MVLTFDSLKPAPTGADGDADETGSGSFATDLCSCLAYPRSCCSVCFCEPCVVGQVLAIGASGREYLCLVTGAAVTFFTVLMVVLQSLPNEATMTVGAIISAGISLFIFAVVLFARSAVRKREGIGGSWLGDCCVSFFCGASFEPSVATPDRNPPSSNDAQGPAASASSSTSTRRRASTPARFTSTPRSMPCRRVARGRRVQVEGAGPRTQVAGSEEHETGSPSPQTSAR